MLWMWQKIEARRRSAAGNTCGFLQQQQEAEWVFPPKAIMFEKQREESTDERTEGRTRRRLKGTYVVLLVIYFLYFVT